MPGTVVRTLLDHLMKKVLVLSPLDMKSLKPREVQSLPKLTQPVCGKTGI